MNETVYPDPRIAAAQIFEDWYGELQEAFSGYHSATLETVNLVTNQDNTSHPIHRWYTLKESFAASLPLWVTTWMKRTYQHNATTICDPFLGSGTTGVTLGSTTGMHVTGIEYNPFIRFAATTKSMSTTVCTDCLKKSISKLEKARIQCKDHILPQLSTFHKTEYIPPNNIQYLLGTLSIIDSLDSSETIKQILRLGVAATIEDAVHLHKDGRALRYRPKQMNVPIAMNLHSRWRNMLKDADDMQRHTPQSQKPLYNVLAGSAISLNNLVSPDGHTISLQNSEFNTSIFSPPYLNNFDYSEVYKLELWLLGFIKTYNSWQDLRLGTMRSHHAIVFPSTNHLQSDIRTKHIAIKIQEMSQSICIPDQERLRISRVLLGYFEDMYLVLKEQWRILCPNSIVACIVANSRHYYLPIATDVMIGEIARCLGFELLDLVVLRKRNGRTRQKSFLRESAIFFRKP